MKLKTIKIFQRSQGNLEPDNVIQTRFICETTATFQAEILNMKSELKSISEKKVPIILDQRFYTRPKTKGFRPRGTIKLFHSDLLLRIRKLLTWRTERLPTRKAGTAQTKI